MVKSWCRLIKSTFLVSQGTHLQPALQTWSGAEASTIPPPPLFEGLKNKYPGPGQIPPHWLVDPAGPVGIAWKIMEKKTQFQWILNMVQMKLHYINGHCPNFEQVPVWKIAVVHRFQGYPCEWGW